MRRFSIPSLGFATSTTSATRVYPIGIISGTRTVQAYDLIAACATASQDALIQTQLNLTSVLLTAGGAIVPQNTDTGTSAPGSACSASSAPTSGVVSGVPLLHIGYNARVTVRWVAPDPDGRISVPGGGTAAGSLLLSQQQIGTSTFNTDHTLYVAE